MTDLAARFGLGAGQVSALEGHRALLLKWNRIVSLVSAGDLEVVVERHYGESLLLAGLLPKGPLRVVDVGSGGGFPGIPMAVARPDCCVTLVESNHKKAAFLREATRGWENVEVVCARAGEVQAGGPTAGCDARANRRRRAGAAAAAPPHGGWGADPASAAPLHGGGGADPPSADPLHGGGKADPASADPLSAGFGVACGSAVAFSGDAWADGVSGRLVPGGFWSPRGPGIGGLAPGAFDWLVSRAVRWRDLAEMTLASHFAVLIGAGDAEAVKGDPRCFVEAVVPVCGSESRLAVLFHVER